MIFEENENYTLHLGNCLDILDTFEENSIDCIITDPPYEIGFMGCKWDNTGIVYRKETWEKCLRVLKPGGYLLCFGAPRNFHRVFCAIEDAGFEIRDTIMWIFGEGFPKGQDLGKSIEAKLTVGSSNTKDFKHLNGDKIISKSTGYSKMNFDHGNRPEHYTGKETTTNVKLSNPIAKQYEGWNSALKPAYEPIMVARKPFKGSLTENVINRGVGGLNIGECRIDFINDKDKKITVDKNQYWDKSDAESDIYSKYEGKRDYTEKLGGRFPANVILTHDESDYDEVCGGFPNSKSTGGKGEKTVKSGLSGNVYNGGWSHEKSSDHIGGLGDEGSNARFFKNCEYTEKDYEDIRRYFYCPKASKTDRNEGCYKNNHPTVKPSNLLKYLIRLVAPKGAVILDPFNGSGSTGKAVMLENKERNKNYKYIGIDLSKEYLEISKGRIDYILGGS